MPGRSEFTIGTSASSATVCATAIDYQDSARPLGVDQPPLDRPSDRRADHEAGGDRSCQSERAARLLDQQDQRQDRAALGELGEESGERLVPESRLGE